MTAVVLFLSAVSSWLGGVWLCLVVLGGRGAMQVQKMENRSSTTSNLLKGMHQTFINAQKYIQSFLEQNQVQIAG